MRVWRKGNLIHYWWECKLVQPLQGTVLRFLFKLKIELPYDPAISPWAYIWIQTIIQKDICSSMFNSQHTATTSVFIDTGMEKDLVHIYNETFSAVKKKKKKKKKERKKERHLQRYG